MALEIPQIYKFVRVGTGINWGHPLSRGLICAIGAHGFDAARRQAILRTSATYAGTVQPGWGVGPTAATGQTPSYDKTLDDAVVSGEFSLVGGLYLPTQPSSATFPTFNLGYFASSSDTERYGFMLDGTGNDLMFLGARNSGTTNFHILDSDVQYPHYSVLGATWTSTTAATVYRNGLSLGSYNSTAAVADTRMRVILGPLTENRFQTQFLYVWNRRLTDSEHAWLAKEPYAIWKQEQPRRIAVAYRNTAVTGTGAITSAAASLDAQGRLVCSGAVDLTTAAASVTATAEQRFAGTAAWASAAASLEASGTVADVSVTGTGALTTQAASLSATAEQRFTGSGATTTAAAGLSATAIQTVTGTAALVTAAAQVSATAAQRYAGTAALATQAASLAAQAQQLLSGAGTVTTSAASLTGTGVLASVGVGVLLSAPASLSGAGIYTAVYDAIEGHVTLTRDVSGRGGITRRLSGLSAVRRALPVEVER